MTTVSEIAPDLFRISTFVPDFNLQFNQFLVRDDEPLLFHTGPRAMFAAVRDAVATLLDPKAVKWIGFSHLESDESDRCASGSSLLRSPWPCAVWWASW